jgi:hypothetical protein
MSFDYTYTYMYDRILSAEYKQKYTTNFRIQTVVMSVRHCSRRGITLAVYIFNVVDQLQIYCRKCVIALKHKNITTETTKIVKLRCGALQSARKNRRFG